LPDKATGRGTIDRRWKVLQHVHEARQASVAELSRHMGVSKTSIRRDLRHLEQMGLVHRIHGGAEPIPQFGNTSAFAVRKLQNVEAKRAIGKAAASLIQPGDTILLDSGTTVLEIARHIPRELLNNGGLTVVTRSLFIAYEFRNLNRVRLVVLGGMYLHDFDVFYGSQVADALQPMGVDTLFIGTDGITAERGLTTDNLLEVGLYPMLVGCCRRVVVVADSSKIGVEQLQTIVSLDDVHSLVMDDATDAGFVGALRERSIEVILAPTA